MHVKVGIVCISINYPKSFEYFEELLSSGKSGLMALSGTEEIPAQLIAPRQPGEVQTKRVSPQKSTDLECKLFFSA